MRHNSREEDTCRDSKKMFKTMLCASGIILLLLMSVGTIGSMYGSSDIGLHYAIGVNAQTGSPDEETNSGFQFAYTKVGMAGGLYQLISYDNETGTLGVSNVSSAGGVSSSQSSKALSESEENDLKQMIKTNGFFDADEIYLPNSTISQSHLLHILSTKIENKTHTVLWSETSNNVPSGVVSIAKAIGILGR